MNQPFSGCMAAFSILFFLALAGPCSPCATAQTTMGASPSPSLLDTGFAEMYKTEFVRARKTVQDFEKLYPDDPMGPTAEAASYLFEEFNRQGVLTSEFFLDDKKLLGGVAILRIPLCGQDFWRRSAGRENSPPKRWPPIPMTAERCWP